MTLIETPIILPSGLLAEKEADLVRLSRLNEMLRQANVQLAEENRELKRRLEGHCSA